MRYTKFPRVIASALVAALTILILATLYINQPQGPLTNDGPVLTEQAEQHLLYGDKRGGGHLHGIGKACKSEFPAGWDAKEVIDHVTAIAANDNLPWKQQNNGYHVAEQMVEDIRVKVVLNQDRTKIITAYPTNVERNPCPRAANDNKRD